MALRLHRGGRFRGWLGGRLGGDLELGDRAWRRGLHVLGSGVLVYYLVPDNFFLVATKEDVLLGALGAVLVLELLRHRAGLELPTIRPYEARRVASFAFFAIALVAAVALFPEGIAVAVVLGTAIVDPLAGELRASGAYRHLYPVVPFLVYLGMAVAALVAVAGWPPVEAVAWGAIAAALALAVERPKLPWVDDDLAMTFVPALVLYTVGVLGLGLPG
jgi:hypothetical protein